MSERVVNINNLTINLNLLGESNEPRVSRARRVAPRKRMVQEHRSSTYRPHIPPEFVNSMAHYVVCELAANGEPVGEFDATDAFSDIDYVPPHEAIERTLAIHRVTETTIAEVVAEDLMKRAEVAAPRNHPSWEDQVAGVHRVLFPSEE